jgi:tetratricopeptide (TPR) repeat protein
MAQAIADFKQTIADSKDPRTLAWAHIYMGRVYDIQDDRDQAMEEYRAALANRDSQPDTRAAAEKGLKEPFVLPKSAQQNNDDDDKTYDPADKYKDLKKPPSQ